MQSCPAVAKNYLQEAVLNIQRHRREHEAMQVLQEESQSLYRNHFTDQVRRIESPLKTEPCEHATPRLWRTKRQIVSYSSQRITQISNRLGASRNPLDKQNKLKSLINKKGSYKKKEEEKLKAVLPSIKNIMTQDLKIVDFKETMSKAVQKEVDKKGRPNKIEELIRKLESIKKHNQKQSIQRLPFIFIQSLVADGK